MYVPRLTTLTLTDEEADVLARCLVMGSTLLDANGDHRDAKLAMRIWERVEPEVTA